MKKSDLEKLQIEEIEVLDEIVRICDKNNIPYFLAAGTLLGAIRHSGFIPWDDDIDIFMLRDDYNKFIECAINEIDDKFFLQCHETDREYYSSFIKVRKNNTLMIEKENENRKSHRGIWVDIFPLDYVKGDSKFLKFKVFLSKLLKGAIFIKIKYLPFKKIRHRYLALPFCILSNDLLHYLSNNLLISKREYAYLANLSGIYPYNKELIPVEKVFPSKKIMFHNKEYTCFNDCDYYLKRLYGNYMELPKKEDRVNHNISKISFSEGDIFITKEQIMLYKKR